MSRKCETALRELQHRCANDLQMIIALCNLAVARHPDQQVRAALMEISNRVKILASARIAMANSDDISLDAMMRLVGECLQAMAEPHGISVNIALDQPTPRLLEDAAIAAGVAVNELATNALKHAFTGRAQGEVKIVVSTRKEHGGCVITVEDDGLPFVAPTEQLPTARRGLGLELARRALAAQGGMLIMPEDNSKRFEIRLPCQDLETAH